MSASEELEFSAEAKLSNQNANLVSTTPAEYASALQTLTTDELRALRHLRLRSHGIFRGVALRDVPAIESELTRRMGG